MQAANWRAPQVLRKGCMSILTIRDDLTVREKASSTHDWARK